MYFSDMRFRLDRKLFAISLPVSAVLSIVIDRALMQDPAISLFLFRFGNAVPALTVGVMGFLITAVLHAAWLLLQLLGVLFSFF